jgi:chromosome segregation ATPase
MADNNKKSENANSYRADVPLAEIEELYETVNDDNVDVNDEDPEKIISDLQEKIARLEKMNNDLRSKNEGLKKNNIENNSVMTRMSLVGLRRKFTSQGDFNQVKNDSVKLAEIIKEKDDLQEMNEKMLDLLTEKELENEDLMQKIENYKLEIKLENEKNLEKIQSLEEKIEMLENSKGINSAFDIDDIINEYNNYKERLKAQVNQYSKNEEELKQQIEMKDRTIQRLNEEIQGLELENLQLVNNSEADNKIKENEILEIEQLKAENDKIKREMGYLDEKLKLAEENAIKASKSHENEIDEFQKKVENEQNNLKLFKEEKSKEINLLKTEINRNNRDISIYAKKIENAEKMLDDEKQKNFMMQNKLDKKVKELQDMNEYTKKLLTNKENLLSQYEGKIEEITKDKNELISQNKELLEKLKSKTEEGNVGNLAEIIKEDEENNREEMQQYIQENKLLKEEIKDLKEQISTQAKDLVDLNSLDKEIEKLKAKNEVLIKDNEDIKKKLEEEIKKREEESFQVIRKREYTLINARKKNITKKGTLLETNVDKINFEKQLVALKKIKEDEKKDYEEQIDKISMELAMLKINYSNYQFESDSLLLKYKNTIKSISNQCKKKGIKLSINLVNIK